MTTTAREFSISVRTAGSYRQALPDLREALKRNSFEILSEITLDRELECKAGKPRERCTLFVVWSPSDAYKALLSDRDGALLVPLNLCVSEGGDSAVVAATNHYGTLGAMRAPIGIQVLLGDLARRVRQVLAELAAREDDSSEYSARQSNEAYVPERVER
jgi:uncharacterized protein (DUF302 family)